MSKTTRTCCCWVPIIMIVLFIGGIFGVYMWLPIGTTFGIADEEIMSGVTMRTLGIHDKSLSAILNTKIGELGNVADFELIEGITLHDLGMDGNTVWDIGTKEIKDLGLYDFDFSVLFKDALEGVSGGSEEFDVSEIFASMAGISFKSLGLGSERLLDFRFGTLFSFIGDQNNIEKRLVPMLGKTLGELGGGQFINTDLIDFVDEENLTLPFGLSLSDFRGIFVVKNLIIKNVANISDLSIMDFFGKIGDIDQDAMLSGLGDEILIDDETIKNTVLEDGFNLTDEEREQVMGEALSSAGETLANAGTPTVGGESIINEEDGSIDYSKIFANEVTFDTRMQISFNDFELTAIFNSIIDSQQGRYKELKDLDAVILQVVILGKNADGSVNVKMTFTMPSAKFAASTGAMKLPITLPENLYFTAVVKITADDDGKLTHEPVSVSIDNLLVAFSNMVLNTPATVPGAQADATFGDYIGELIGELFTIFMNNMGKTGTFDGQDEVLGSDGFIEEGHIIYIVTRTTADNQEIEEAA